MDLSGTTCVSRHVGGRELNLYRIAGMTIFYAIGYVRYPRRFFRTLRNVRLGRSETVLEQRLVEYKQRRDMAISSAGRGATSAGSLAQ